MSSSGLPFPTSNGAPQPIPGGYGNPTGANTGFPSSSGGGLPFPVSANGPASNAGPWGTGTSLQGLNTGLNASNTSWDQNLFNELGRAYGKGTGQLLGDILSNGLFNPQIAAAFLNAQQPGIARGQANIQGSFADAGARFSSAAGIGLGDFNSQVQLNQQQTLAQLYENAQQEQLSVLSAVLPTLHTEEANHSGGLMHDIIGGLELAGGIGIDAFTGGLGGNGLIVAGAGTLAGGGGGSSAPAPSGSNSLGTGLTQAIQAIMGKLNPTPGTFSGGSVGGVSDPALGKISAMPPTSQLPDPLTPLQTMQGSAGFDLGGAAVNMPGTSNASDYTDFWNNTGALAW
jgi:hypothetical protein